jgi:hypothetical protein
MREQVDQICVENFPAEHGPVDRAMTQISALRHVPQSQRYVQILDAGSQISRWTK